MKINLEYKIQMSLLFDASTDLQTFGVLLQNCSYRKLPHAAALKTFVITNCL